MTQQIKKGDMYKGGKVINMGIQGEWISGRNGGKLPCKKSYIGKTWVIVQFSDYSTTTYYI